MQMVLVLLAAVLSPLLGLALLLWLDRLEDSLPRAVDAALRQPTPAPILAVAVRSDQPVPALEPTRSPVPEQRPAPAPDLVPDLAVARPAVGG